MYNVNLLFSHNFDYCLKYQFFGWERGSLVFMKYLISSRSIIYEITSINYKPTGEQGISRNVSSRGSGRDLNIMATLVCHKQKNNKNTIYGACV